MSGSPRETWPSSRLGRLICIWPQRAHDRRCGPRIRDRHETFRKWVGLRISIVSDDVLDDKVGESIRPPISLWISESR